MFLLESPANTGVFQGARDLINWTATYRFDSTIVTPYEKFVPYRNASASTGRRGKRLRRSSPAAESLFQSNIPGRNYAAGKTKMVAWFVSNCGPKNKRNEYAAELAKYASLCLRLKGAITSKIKHAVKLKTSPARLAQLLQPLAFCFSLQPMTAHWTSCRTCFKFYCMFYFTCDRYLKVTT